MKQELRIEDFLSSSERERYFRLMATVRSAVTSLVGAGRSLAVIRDQRLYRDKYDTFETFCHSELQMTRGYAARLITGREYIESQAFPKAVAEGEIRMRIKRIIPVKVESVHISKKRECTPLARAGARALAGKHSKASLVLHTYDEQEQIDKEFIERMRTVDRLLKIKTNMFETPLNIIEEALRIVRSAESQLKALKEMLLNRIRNHKRLYS